MENSKLIQILYSLSYKERKKLRLFIESPFHNEDVSLLTLFDFLEEHCFFLKNDPPSREYCWERLFPDITYDDAKMRKLSSNLGQLTEDFLAYQNYSKQQVNRSANFLAAVNELDLDKHFSYSFRQAKKAQENESHRDADFYYNQFRLESSYTRFLTKRRERSGETNLQQTVDTLDSFYLINKLKYCCEILNYKNVVKIDENLLLMDEILLHLEKNSYEHIPAIAIYYRVLMCLLESDKETHFSELKTLLSQHADKFPSDEAMEIYTHAINYCIRKFNNGKREYLKEIFEMYEVMLEKEIVLQNNDLSPWAYKNIVFTALRLRKFKWAKDFIHDYRKRIAPEHRKNAFTYNLARYHFAKQDYDQVIELLQQVEYNDVFYGVDSRAILLKTYYELDETEALYGLLDSFTLFLRRNKLIARDHKSSYLNRIRFVKKLIKIKPRDKKRLEKLKQELDSAGPIADVKWLKDKLKERMES